MKSKWLFALLAAALGTGVYAGNVLATTSTPPQPITTVLGGPTTFDPFQVNAHNIPADTWHAKLKTHGTSDVYVVDNKFASGASTGWHSHPGPSLILVTAGTITNHMADNCSGQTYSAGTGFIDPGGGDVHMLTNGASGPAETIAVQLLPHGAVRKTPAQPPARCQ
jgi:quercetin dioxygenase-like cupin family protein